MTSWSNMTQKIKRIIIRNKIGINYNRQCGQRRHHKQRSRWLGKTWDVTSLTD
jgi:hypothetical protein